MNRYNIHWIEICNVETYAEDLTEALAMWVSGNFGQASVVREILDAPEIKLIEGEIQEEVK